MMSFKDSTEVYDTTSTYMTSTIAVHEVSQFYINLGSILTYVIPHGLPIDILKSIFQSNISILQVILETLKLQSGFICLCTIFVVITLLPLSILIGWTISRAKEIYQNSGSQINASAINSLLTLDESVNAEIDCSKKSVSFILQVFVLFTIADVIGIFITNEQISSSIDQTPKLVLNSIHDIDLFLRDSHNQILTVLNERINIGNERVKNDLDDIDKLLGEPIEKLIALETGIEDNFESLLNICTVNAEIIQRVQTLRYTLSRAIKISQEASMRIEELQIQLSALQRQCSQRDRPLCDTLRLKGFDEIGITNSLRQLQTDPIILRMITIDESDIDNSHRNLSSFLAEAQSKFRRYPQHVRDETVIQKESIVRELSNMQDSAELAFRTLSSTLQRLLSQTSMVLQYLQPTIIKFHEIGNIIWSSGIATCLIILVATTLMIMSLSCGCCHSENKASIALIISGIFISLSSIAIGVFFIFTIFVGGHGSEFICKPLYDHPDYNILDRLFDKPGLIYENHTTNGIIDVLLRPHGAYMDPFNISLSSILNECAQNSTTFATFQLNNLLNLTSYTNWRRNDELTEALKNVTAPDAYFENITQNLQTLLNRMLENSRINLTRYRLEINHPTPEKDLATFTDQMQRVSLQIQDIATASRMTTLGSRARRIQATLMHPLEQLRGDVLYHLTALELQREPWTVQVNHSLINLRKVQFFLDQNARDLSANRSQQFVNRLKNHMDSNHNRTYEIVMHETGKCRMLFDVFDTGRSFLCQNIIIPLNGLWFLAGVCLSIWIVSTPCSLYLSSAYRKLSKRRISRYSSNPHYGEPAETISSLQQHIWSSGGVGGDTFDQLQIRPNDPAHIGDIDRPIHVIDISRRQRIKENEVTHIYFNDDLNYEILI